MGLVTPPGLVFRELLHQSPRTTVFRARDTGTGSDLIVKSPSNPIPQADEIASYRQECHYCNLLQAESARCLEHAGQIYLLRPDCHGRPLAQLQPDCLDLHRLLNQALQQLQILARAGVVHQEIQPGHLIWSQASGLRLVGWSAATGRATNPADLRYRAPEQTGRLQRAVDARTDLYGLGISLWECLSGRPPFHDLHDPLELIHALLARELPPVAGDLGPMVAHLLAKDPEQRFATPEAARHQMPLPFLGRQAEIDRLEERLEQVCQGGQCTVLITGSPGMGKSALLRQLGQRWSTRPRLWLGRGRYLGFAPQRGLQGLWAALEEVLGRILASPESERLWWQQRLGQKLDLYRDLLVTLVPSLNHCLCVSKSSTPPLTVSPSVPVAVAALVACLARPCWPLVLLLDDLHQADEDSRKLLEFLLADPSIQGLLVLATCPSSPDQLLQAPQAVCQSLPPLNPQEIAAYLSSVQHPLAQDPALDARCQGNPLMLRWLLTGWPGQQAGPDVLELLLEQFQQLPEPSRQALIRAAGLGQRFHPADLADDLQVSPALLQEQLKEALQLGLIESLDGGYQFCHEAVHRAAYQALCPEQRARQHLNWGNRLADKAHRGVVEQAEQLRLGLPAMSTDQERLRFAALALRASAQLRQTGAFERALVLLGAARQASAQAWHSDYPLRLAVVHEFHRLCLIQGEHDQVQEALDEIWRQSRNLVDQIPAWISHIRLLMARGEVDAAYQVARQFLVRAGRPLEFQAGPASLGRALLHTLWVLRGRTPESLRPLAETHDPLLRAIQEVQTLSAPLQARVQPETLPLGILRDVRCLLQDGLTAEGAQCWTGFGLLLCQGLQQVPLGMRFAELALFQVQRLNRPDIWPRVALLAYLMVFPWGRPLELIRPEMDRIAQQALAWGDTMVGFLASLVGGIMDMALGRPLPQVLQHTREVQARMALHQHRDGLSEMQALEAAVEALQQGPPTALPGPLQPQTDPLQAATLYLQLQQALVFQNHQRALQLVEQGAEIMTSPVVSALSFLFFTYAGLVYHRSQRPSQARRAERRVARWTSHVPARKWRLSWLRAAGLRASQASFVATLESYEQALQGARQQGFCNDAALIAEEVADYLQPLRPALAQDYRAQAAALYRQWGASAKADQLQPPKPPQASLLNLDLQTIVRAAQALSGEIELPALLRQMVKLSLENAGGQRGLLLLHQEQAWSLAVQARAGEEADLLQHEVDLDQAHPLVPTSVLRYTFQTRQLLIVNEPLLSPQFASDDFFKSNRPLSLLCLPLQHGGELVGLLYLEHSLAPHALVAERAEVLRTLSAQMAISLQNARHFAKIQSQHRQILAEQDLRHQEALKLQALQSRKEALAAVLSIASHDLRNPLAVIQMWIHQLGPEPESQRLLQVQRNVEAACHRANSLIATYLDVASLERGRMLELRRCEVALDALLETEIEFLLDTLTPEQRSQACLQWELSPVRAWVDPERIRQVVGNLVGNSLKYCPPGTPIHISLSSGEHDWELQVIDEGPGIPPEQQPRLFEPFERRSSLIQGSGLGLWICRVIVEAHEGQWGLDSPWNGRGCRFWCRIPRGAGTLT